jgi:hypothetical protein
VKPAALFLCDYTGNMARPWADAGYDCWCVDIQHSIRADRVEGNIRFVWGDVRSWCPPNGVRFEFVAAFPPCTHLASSGARDWFKKGHSLLTDALELWTACQVAASYSGAPYCIENPVGALSRHMREPDYTFHPCDYAGYAADPAADAYTKKTCLWTGNGFVMPNRRPVEPTLGSMMHRLPPSDDRANQRSATPSGFARAVFEANASKHQMVAA